ncbi:hypothetical protein CRYUN_Cryun16bG0053800 [Craigia yunnanensis]
MAVKYLNEMLNAMQAIRMILEGLVHTHKKGYTISNQVILWFFLLKMILVLILQRLLILGQ